MTRELSDLLLGSCERCGDPIDFVADSVEPRLCGTCGARMAWRAAREQAILRRPTIAPSPEYLRAFGNLCLGIIILGVTLLLAALIRGLGASGLPF